VQESLRLLQQLADSLGPPLLLRPQTPTSTFGSSMLPGEPRSGSEGDGADPCAGSTHWRPSPGGALPAAL
jgi:hypothetical protein